MNDSLQGDERRRRPARAASASAPGGQTGAAGNPIDISYDWSSTLGGPIKRDKLWFFGATAPLAARPVPDRRRQSRRLAGHRRQPHRQLHGQGSPGRRRPTPAPRSCSTATSRTASTAAIRPTCSSRTWRPTLQDQPAQNYVAQVNQVVGQRGVFDARFGRMWGDVPEPLPGRSPTDIAVRDVVRFTRINAAEIQSINPNHRYQANGNYSYFVPNLAAARTTSRPACSCRGSGWPTTASATATSCSSCATASAFQGQIANTPIVSDHKMETWGAFLQDRWMIGRATINARRPPRRRLRLPARAVEPGRHLRRRAVVPGDRHLRLLDERRAAPRHLLRRVRQRPDRGQGLLRPLLQPVRLGDRRSDEPERAGHPERDAGPTATPTGGSTPASSARAGVRRAACSRPSTRTPTGPTATR